jgi:g-D-glutamyl-meso-diaminopimelate peptidase
MHPLVEKKIASFKNVEDMIFSLCARYSFLKLKIIGKSELNKNIYSLYLGENDKKILYMGAFHGQEWMTSLIILKFIEGICECYRMGGSFCDISIDRIFDDVGLIFVPIVNPDGVDIALFGESATGKYKNLAKEISGGDYSDWNANARGVDINHNFDAGFCKLREIEREAGINGPSKRRFGGEYPESESETRAISHLCRDVNLKHALCFHSQGEEIFYEYGENTSPESYAMARVLSLSSGYSLVKQGGLASHGGCKDFIIDKLKKPAFTIEIGKGKNPLPLDDFDSIYSKIAEMLILSAII